MHKQKVLAGLLVSLALGAGVVGAVMLSRLRSLVSFLDADALDEPAYAVQAEPPPLVALPEVAEPLQGRTPAPAPPAPVATRDPHAEPEPEPEPEPVRPEAAIDPPSLSGPVEEFKAEYASEPRDADAYSFEEIIESAFEQHTGGNGLLDRVECHRTVCQIDLRWTPDRAEGFLLVFTELLMNSGGASSAFMGVMAVDPDEPSVDGAHPVTVYIHRQ